MKNHKTQKGSALIIALLIMGILMTLALGLSNLVIREVRITSDVVNSGKAYYAAESGVESALLDLHQNLPGYETQGGMYKGKESKGDFKIEEDLTFEYSIANKTHTYPYVDTEIIDINVAQDSPKKYQYNELGLSDSISIPLFTVDEDGNVEKIESFRIEFFIDAQINQQYSQAVTNLYIDMLRWKITGIRTDKGFYTESIGDYMPVFEGSTSTTPTCLGTPQSEGSFKDPDSGITYPASCKPVMWTWAREAYLMNNAGQIEARMYEPDPYSDNPITDPVFIDEFLENHETNYLTLTNIFNPDVLASKPGVDRADLAKIYYRIIVPDQEIVREFAKIKSVGSFGKLRQQVEAFIRPDGFLPVFNFSLYRTDTSSDKETTTGFAPSEE